MPTLLVVFIVLLPLALIAALMRLATWRHRTRCAAVARQIAVTDAIHAELGAVVAPVVRSRLGGRWQVVIPVPFDRPDTVKRVVEAAHGAFDGPERMEPGRFEIVLSPQQRPTPRTKRAVARAARGASVSWT